jgi:hypothetical protein
MPVENVTPNQGYPLPHATNELEFDVARVIDAIEMIDVDVAAAGAAIATKAPLASPALTGVPTAPTAAPGTDTGQLATTAYVLAAIAALIGSVPSTLNTLDELAAALGDDPNFATTITTLIGTKLNSSAYTAADVLAKLLTVDGAGSGLDADLLDGRNASAATAANTIVQRDGNGDIFGRYINMGHAVASRAGDTVFFSGNAGNGEIIQKNDAAGMRSSLGFSAFIQSLRAVADKAAFLSAFGGVPTLVTQAFSAGGNTFSSIPSWAQVILIGIAGLSSNGSNNIVLQLGDSGGLENTGYTGTSNFNGTGSVTSLSNAFNITTAAAANVMNGVVALVKVDAANNTWACIGMAGMSSGLGIAGVAGFKSLSAALDRFFIAGGGGDNLDAGTIGALYF